ncbi:YesL family protein [Bifidobacterium criceti]|uniref:Beta-carotene 15,15'-monooxygenase n=1 Tax=Bifidobacterium criceti TaxID=1960969 RepID=A0A2A2EIE7_9BIFI|nr:YesL family protein [Bifidobacterium criceti]PAU68801.1 hypothetical protein B1526_0227 [Bifidobacterium criceti]
MGTLARFTALNLVFLATLLPVVTIGPAQAALYSTLFRYDEHDDVDLVREYLRRFKREFAQGLINGLLLLMLVAAVIFGLAFWAAWDSDVAYRPLILLVAGAVTTLFITEYLFPLQARFSNPIGRTWKLAAMFPWRAFACSFALVMIDTTALALAYFVPFIRVLMLIFGMSWVAYAKSLILLWGFRKYGGHGEVERPTFVNANSGL